MLRSRAWMVCAVALVLVAPRLATMEPRVFRPGDTLAPQAQSNSCDITAPGRIVAIGDVHGAFDRYTTILREAKLVDAKHHWIGGNATLVHTGDLVDRGNESKRVLDLVRQLEGEARKAGGMVKLLLGNHEVMRMAGDWRYVTKADLESYRTPESAALREKLYAEVLKANENLARSKGQKFDAKEFRKEFLEKTELGAIEMEEAFSPTGRYGSWLREHDVMARINDIIFVHAGPARTFAERGCAALNALAREEMKSLNLSDPNIRDRSLWSADGPLWYRGLVGVEPAASPNDVTAILKGLGASKIVVGHTASTPGRIRSMQDGRVIAIDSGMLGGEMFPNGVPSALEIENGKFTAIYEGKRDEVVITRDPPASTRR